MCVSCFERVNGGGLCDVELVFVVILVPTEMVVVEFRVGFNLEGKS